MATPQKLAIRYSLPDYYADERLAKRRVRMRHTTRWLCLALAGGAFLLWQAGR
jgi:hypothetical protein